MPHHIRIQDKLFIAKEFGLESVSLDLEEPTPEQRFYPTKNAEDEKEFRFTITGKELYYCGHVLIKAGRVHFYNLFPGQESLEPESHPNLDFKRRARIISKAIEDEVLVDFD
jgi:hypothetical protein